MSVLDVDGKLVARNEEEEYVRDYRWDAIMAKFDRPIGALQPR